MNRPCALTHPLYTGFRAVVPWPVFAIGSALVKRLCDALWQPAVPQALTAVLDVRAAAGVVVPLAYLAASLVRFVAPRRADCAESEGCSVGMIKCCLKDLWAWLSAIVYGAILGAVIVLLFWVAEGAALAWSPDEIPGPLRLTFAMRDVTAVAVSVAGALGAGWRVFTSSVDHDRIRTWTQPLLRSLRRGRRYLGRAASEEKK